MRMSKLFIPTLKEVPAEAEITSHRLMLRAGLIRKLASGIYSYLPLGYRVIRKIENIIREVFDSYGAQELLLPALHPIEIWNETGRDEEMGQNMFRLYDRNRRQFCLGMTHEEIITDLARKEIKSYKDLPVAFYQIQTKFRDEPRPRSGIIRAREFVMKDLYSFHRSWESLDDYYKKMYQAYLEVFTRCGMDVQVVLGDPGAMGGDYCHEFMCISQAGEDTLLICGKCGYGSSKVVARFHEGNPEASQEKELAMEEADTPDVKSIEDLVCFLKIDARKFLKSMIYRLDNNRFVMAIVRGDRIINEGFLQSQLKTGQLRLAAADEIEKLTGAPMGFSGPVGIRGLEIIADEEVKFMKNFVTGANKKDKHLLNVNLDRDFKAVFAPIREAEEGDLCPKCSNPLGSARGIELGHIFKLGTKYSDSMKAHYTDEDGREKPFIMGCYGIGVTRIVPSIIEASHDDAGIIWPLGVAPYHIVVIPVVAQDIQQFELAEKIYNQLKNLGYEVVLDDRFDLRAGVKFKDADLIGFPVRIVAGKAVKDGKLEIKLRNQKESFLVNIEDLFENIKKIFRDEKKNGQSN